MRPSRLLLALLLAPALAVAAPATLRLASAEQRVVELSPGTDAEAFAARNGLESFELVPLAGGGARLRFTMDEGSWRARQGALCTDRGVAGCGTDACLRDFGPAELREDEARAPPGPAAAQPPAPSGEVVLDGRIESVDAGERPAARILLVPRPPDLGRLFATDAGGADVDPATVAGPPGCPDPPDAPAATGVLATPAADGGVLLRAPRGVAGGRACWDVVTVDRCVYQRRPLSDYGPDVEPRRVIVLLGAPAAERRGAGEAALRQYAAGNGLRVLEAVPLAALGGLLVRLELTDPGADPEAALARLAEQGGVELAQHEFRYDTSGRSDPFAWMNYGAGQSGADRLQTATSGAGVAVAVIDTGIDAEHAELAGRVVARVDVTGYGTTADRHGTAVAGVIAAAADNGVDAYGMAPEATLIAIKACQPEARGALAARCWSSTLAKGLDAALARAARIVNLSLGGPRDPLLERLVAVAVARGVLVVAAAGNSGPDGPPSYPAAYPGVLAVGAVDSRGRAWPQSTRGAFVTVAAPGVSVPVPVPGENYPAQLSGTSMAAPHVSGVAALLLALKPAAGGAELLRALVDGRRPPGPATGPPASPGQLDGCAAAARLGVAPPGCGAAAAAEPPR